MASIDTTRRSVAGSRDAGRLSNVLLSIFSALSAWSNARQTRRELDRLSDHELDDIGLSRGEIDALAERLAR